MGKFLSTSGISFPFVLELLKKNQSGGKELNYTARAGNRPTVNIAS